MYLSADVLCTRPCYGSRGQVEIPKLLTWNKDRLCPSRISHSAIKKILHAMSCVDPRSAMVSIDCVVIRSTGGMCSSQ